MSKLKTETKEKVLNLIDDYVFILDRLQLEEWVTLFAEMSGYYVISRENFEQGLPIHVIFDDSLDRIQDRVTYIREVWKDHYNPYQSRHILSNIKVDSVDENYQVQANFAYYSSTTQDGTRLVCVGEYDIEVIFEKAIPKFKKIRVILDTNVLPEAVVYPL